MNKLRRMNSLFVATTMFVFFMVLVTFGCKKKIQDTVWINKLDLGGIELENTMTCLADGTFAVKTSTVFLGLPISITAAEGVYSGDLSEDGEASFTVEKIAQEFNLFVPEDDLAKPPISRTVYVKDGNLSIDIGIGQELDFVLQSSEQEQPNN